MHFHLMSISMVGNAMDARCGPTSSILLSSVFCSLFFVVTSVGQSMHGPNDARWFCRHCRSCDICFACCARQRIATAVAAPWHPTSTQPVAVSANKRFPPSSNRAPESFVHPRHSHPVTQSNGPYICNVCRTTHRTSNGVKYVTLLPM